ncbi:hypothetical protein P280DRAFT_548085 [Massarina eburnea CBS 473.64]|uniref:Uncharacterized protein n=1 Tax=Massarina eburnea CBS 473.64 TaxID=1395130 RepID=A0A6A6S7C5_9PLEO|nr:hypothetical protein P280DRAFT_548085 [Massarina eburnea CBS 473.64]
MFKIVLDFILAASVVHGAVITRTTDYVDEGVFLAHCTVTETASKKEVGTNSIIYYNQYIDRPNAQFYPGYPTDPAGKTYNNGKIDWTSGKSEKPITASLGGQMPFQVWDLTAEGDRHTNATGYAKLNGKDMRCYRPNQYMETLWVTPLIGSRIRTAKYTNCVGDYICTRESRQVRRTEFEFSEDTLDVAVSITESPSEPQNKLISKYLTDAFKSLTDIYNPETLLSSGTIAIMSADAKLNVNFDMQEKKDDGTFDKNRMPRIQNELASKLVDKLFKEKSKPNCKQTPPSRYPTCEYTIKFPKQIYIASQVADQQFMRWSPTDRITISAQSTKKNKKCEQNKKAMEILSAVFGVANEVKSGWFSAAAGGLGFVAGKVGSAGKC